MDELFFKQIQSVAIYLCDQLCIGHISDDVASRVFLALAKNPGRRTSARNLVIDAIKAECGIQGSNYKKHEPKSRYPRDLSKLESVFEPILDNDLPTDFMSGVEESIDRENLFARIKEELTRREKIVFEEVYTLNKTAIEAAKSLGITDFAIHWHVRRFKKFGRSIYERELVRVESKHSREHVDSCRSNRRVKGTARR